jgi:plasmid stabilization system protein ParE
MLPLVWTEAADEDLAVITDFIGQRNLKRPHARLPTDCGAPELHCYL